MKPYIRAVIFDLDGLLLDTEPILRRVDTEAVSRYGGVLTDELRQRALGLPHEVKDELFVRELGLMVAPEVLSLDRSKMLEELLPAAELMPGAESLVSTLAAGGIPMAIASSSDSAAVQKKLQRYSGIVSAMTAIATCDHPRVRHSKPAPDIFLAAAFDLKVAPANCLAFEDAPSGIESALAAEMTVVAVPDPHLPPHPILQRADQVLRSLTEFDPRVWGLRVS
jgi:pseudouridine-5'-monophosphatase